MAPVSKPPEKGLSVGAVLLITAVVGTVAGAVLGGVGGDRLRPEDVERIAEQEVERTMPRIAPLGPEQADPMAPDPASLSGIPPYPGVYPRKMTGRSYATNAPMAISWFSTTDPWDTVLGFYDKAFKAEGRKTFTHRRGEMGYVAWLDEAPDAGLAGGVLHMITAMRQFSQTVVLISASRPDLMMNAPAVVPEGLELPPNSTEPQSVVMGENTLASQVLYARALNQSPQAVVSHFAAQFQKGQFKVLETTETAGQGSITGQRGAMTVTVAARAEGAHASIVMTYDRRPETEPGANTP